VTSVREALGPKGVHTEPPSVHDEVDRLAMDAIFLSMDLGNEKSAHYLAAKKLAHSLEALRLRLRQEAGDGR